MDLETGTNNCDWCDRPATRGFGPATGATHFICAVHDAAPDLLAALEGLLTPCPPGTHVPGPNGECPECDVEKQARDAIAKAKGD